MTEPKKVKRTDSKRESVARCGRLGLRACPLGKVRVSRGGTCQKLGTLHHRGERTREVGEGDSDAEISDLALCPHAVRGDPPQG